MRKIKPKLSKQEKEIKKFTKLIKMMLSKKITFEDIDGVLYVIYEKEHMKAEAPEPWQNPTIKKYIFEKQNGNEKQYLEALKTKEN